MRTEFDVGPEGFPVPTGAPSGFVPHAYRRSFVVPFGVERVWGWLNDPATFTEGQVWPFRVEFVDGGFELGVLNVHHGPFLNVAGVIGGAETRGRRFRPTATSSTSTAPTR
ncbi:MAG: hypothetical protein M3N45_11355 [Actinomycetota bacterium]|nr:hypothetical protein [Actinomycetota bacterium]